MAMRVAGFALGGGAEYDGCIVIALDVGLLGEIEIAPVSLALAGKGVLEVLFSAGTS